MSRKRKYGWLSNYCGLGGKGDPRHKTDEHCQEHDQDYDTLPSPAKYFKYNWADEKFQKKLSDTTPTSFEERIVHTGAKVFFSLKKRIAPSFSNLPESAKKRVRRAIFVDNAEQNVVTMATTSNNDQGAVKETPVDDPYIVYRGPPEYTYASLPWMSEKVVERGTLVGSLHQFRPTSVYDPNVAIVESDTNAGAGFIQKQSASGSDSLSSGQPMYYSYYSSLYKYYTVVGCRWKATIENLGPSDIDVVWMYHGTVQPNFHLATTHDMMLWNGANVNRVKSGILSIDSNGYAQTLQSNTVDESDTSVQIPITAGQVVQSKGNSIVSLSGQYKTGDFTRQIIDDAAATTWTPISQNPSLTERLSIYVKPDVESAGFQATNTNSANSFSARLKYRIRFQVDYLVEFKELNDNLKFPVNRQPLVNTIADPTNSANYGSVDAGMDV